MTNRYWPPMNEERRYGESEKGRVRGVGIPVPRPRRSVQKWDWVRLECRGSWGGWVDGVAIGGDGSALKADRKSGEDRILLKDDITAVTDDMFAVTNVHHCYARIGAG